MHRDKTFQESTSATVSAIASTPPQPGECEGQHQVGVTAGLLGQPAQILLGEIDMAFR